MVSLSRPNERRAAVTLPPRRVMIADIQRAVTEHYALGSDALLSHRRWRRFARPRQLAMWLAQVMTDHSFPTIGDLFNRDHTTVMHACKVVPVRLLLEPELRLDCRAVIDRADLIRRSNVIPFPVTKLRAGNSSVACAMSVLAAEMRRDLPGTLAKLLRRTIDGPEIEDR